MTLSQAQEVLKFKFEEFKSVNFPKLTDGLAFMQYATALALQGFQLTETDLQAGITEGKDDGGIDGFHIVVDRTEAISETTRGLSVGTPPRGTPRHVPFDVVVIQSKSSWEGGFDSLALPKLHEVLNEILSGSSTRNLLQYPLNTKVVGQVDAYRKYRKRLISLDPVRSFTVYAMQPVVPAKITTPMKRSAKAMKTMIQGYLGDSTQVRVELLDVEGMERLRNASRDAKGLMKFSSLPLKQTHGKSSAWPGLVTVKDMLAFLGRPKTGSLRDEFFTTNVRSYGGAKTLINRAIHETLANDTQTAFWWMNNGVTIIVDQAKYQSDDCYELVNPQIVNGLQTSNVIHEASQGGSITKKRLRESILVRIIGGLDSAVRESIIQGTNNQTPVNSIQLYANDPHQLDIENYLETQGWHYERRRWQYRSMSVPRARIRSILELAQTVIAVVHLEPDTARARPRNRLDSKNEYKRIFSQENPLSLYGKLLDAHEAVESYLRTSAAQHISDDPTNDRYYLLTASALRVMGFKDRESCTAQSVANRISTPDEATLEAAHKRMYGLVDQNLGKQDRDRLFKSAAFRNKVVEDVLVWNL